MNPSPRSGRVGDASARPGDPGHAVLAALCAILAAVVAADVGVEGRSGDHQAAAPAPLGIIRGKVEIRRPLPAFERRPNVGDLAMPPARDLPDRSRSVVYLETAPRGAFEERDGARARMDQRNENFAPYVLAIIAGTTVEFPNNDRTYHNVFSLSKPKRFDLGRYAAGKSKSVRFDRPGIVRVFCDIHSHMSAFILVFGHRFFAVTDSEGRYRIDNVPPGRYTVIAWNEGEPRDARQAIIREEGGPVEIDFALR